MNSKNLFVWNRDRFSIISKNPDYAIRFQYLKMDIRVYGCPNKEIPRKKRKVDSLSTIFSQVCACLKQSFPGISRLFAFFNLISPWFGRITSFFGMAGPKNQRPNKNIEEGVGGTLDVSFHKAVKHQGQDPNYSTHPDISLRVPKRKGTNP